MPGRRKGRDDSDMGSEKDETGSFETLRDEGMYFVHVQLYQKAVESFTRASEMNPEDNVVLVTRAKCYLQLGQAENALADAEQALSHDKDYIRGLLMKAEALYQLGHFETALVFFHRGHKLRQELGEFRLGIQKAQEAINNSIGGPSSVKLDTTGDLSFFDKQENPVIEPEPPSEDENDKDHRRKSKKPPPKTYGKPGAQKATQKERERPKSAADTKTIKQLLEELYADKTYLEKLLGDENLTGGRSYTERELKGHICDGLDYLNNRADFWRQQKPMYARKRDREKMRRGGKSRPRDPVQYIMQNLENIDEAQADGHYETSLNTAKKLMKTVKEMPEEDLANKWEIIANIYSQMGNAYLEMAKYSPAIENHEQDLDIAEIYGLEDAKSRALDNIGRVHARRGHFEKAIEVWEKKLPLSKSPLEKTWLFHEIGRCYLESEKYDKAKDYGEKSLAAAQEADDDGWQLHATVLVAQSEVKSLDYSSAQTSFEEALELAKRLEDDAAMNAVNKALEEVKEKIARGYRAGEDEDGDEVDAKKVDYKPEVDDGRKSSQSKDSKKMRAGEDEEEGRKSRASSKAGYEDDFEEDKEAELPPANQSDHSEIEQPIDKKTIDNEYGKCNETKVDTSSNNSFDNSVRKKISNSEQAFDESQISSTTNHLDTQTSENGGKDVQETQHEILSVSKETIDNKEGADEKGYENKENKIENEGGKQIVKTEMARKEIIINKDKGQVTGSENNGTPANRPSDVAQESGKADQETKANDSDDRKSTPPKECEGVTDNAITDRCSNNEADNQNQVKDVSESRHNRQSDEFLFKYINDSTGSRPSSKDSQASPPKSGNIRHRQTVDDPKFSDISDGSKIEDTVSKAVISQQTARKPLTRPKSSGLAGNVRPREKVEKQKSLEDTRRTGRNGKPKDVVSVKKGVTVEKTRTNQSLSKKEAQGRKSTEGEKKYKHDDVDEEQRIAGNKSKTKSGIGNREESSNRRVVPQKQRSAESVRKQQSISKDPRRKSDLSPYDIPATANQQSKRSTGNFSGLQKTQTNVTRLKQKSNETKGSDISSQEKSFTKESAQNKSRDKKSSTGSKRSTTSPVVKPTQGKKTSKDESRGSQTAQNATSSDNLKEKSLSPEQAAPASIATAPDQSQLSRGGVKEEIIDKAPTSPTRRSEGSGRRSVEASSPFKRSPLHSPTKRSLAGSPTKRSAQPSPSKMSQSSRRPTYSPTKQSREVSFKEGSAKGSMKGSAKGSAGGRSAPGSAQQRASPAAGGSATGSARGSAKGSVGAFAATTTEGKDETEEIPDETTKTAEVETNEQKAASPAPADTATKEEAIDDESPPTKGQD